MAKDKKLNKVKASKVTKATKTTETASKPSKEKNKTEVAEQVEQALQKPSKSLGAITKAISAKFTAEARTAIEIGGLLKDAQFYFIPKGGKKVKTADWLVWANEKFGIKKAQAYNLMAINRVFADMPSFGDVQTQVLAALTRDESMMKDAEEALEAGETVDAKWLKAYRKERLEAKAADSGDSEELEEGEDSAGKSASEAQREKDEKFIKSLEDRIEQLEQEKADAKANALTARSKAITAYMSKLQPYQILAVAEDSDKRKANAAKRKIAKAYEGMPEVLELIEGAASTF